MTRWGLILLVAYIALGLSAKEPGRDVKLALWLTVAVIVGVSVRVGAL